MGVDRFHLRIFMNNCRMTKPPYHCPKAKDCQPPECTHPPFKTLEGIEKHLIKQHAELLLATPNKSETVNGDGASGSGGFVHSSPHPPLLPAGQAKNFVKLEAIDADGEKQAQTFLAGQPLDVELVDDSDVEEDSKADAINEAYKQLMLQSPTSKKSSADRLPDGHIGRTANYQPGTPWQMPKFPIQFRPPTQETLNQMVEYEMDDEDTAWLRLMNDRRQKLKLGKVDADDFEFLLDRMEKECHFEQLRTGSKPQKVVDDDAPCSVCNDVACENSNMILFCDMCNMAVHQDCYGVPFIPEGIWICRRCRISPSKPVKCIFCPHQDCGAYKPLDDGRWTHIVCSIWIPELHFGNVQFLEPIEGVNNIPPSRWKLRCSLCKKGLGSGACIQCNKTQCSTSFHATCALKAGVYMRAYAIPDQDHSDVARYVFCHMHAPDKDYDEEHGYEAAEAAARGRNGPGGERLTPQEKEKRKQEYGKAVKAARKALSNTHSVPPPVNVPVVPKHKVEEMAGQVDFDGKEQFMPRVVAYWTLKRKSRCGVPLLRRLQVYYLGKASEKSGGVATIDGYQKFCDKDKELCSKLVRAKQLLDLLRTTMELVKTREKVKNQYVQDYVQQTVRRIDRPIEHWLHEIVDKLETKDRARVFTQPVSEEEVPGYRSIIAEPMDLSQMRKKIDRAAYESIAELKRDFDLMIKNCLTFNRGNPPFIVIANRMKSLGAKVFSSADSEYRMAAQFSRPSNLLKSGSSEPVKTGKSRSQKPDQKSIFDILPLKLLDDDDLKIAMSGLGSRQAVSEEWQETMQSILNTSVEISEKLKSEIQKTTGSPRKKRAVTPDSPQPKGDNPISEAEECTVTPPRKRARQQSANKSTIARKSPSANTPKKKMRDISPIERVDIPATTTAEKSPPSAPTPRSGRESRKSASRSNTPVVASAARARTSATNSARRSTPVTAGNRRKKREAETPKNQPSIKDFFGRTPSTSTSTPKTTETPTTSGTSRRSRVLHSNKNAFATYRDLENPASPIFSAQSPASPLSADSDLEILDEKVKSRRRLKKDLELVTDAVPASAFDYVNCYRPLDLVWALYPCSSGGIAPTRSESAARPWPAIVIDPDTKPDQMNRAGYVPMPPPHVAAEHHGADKLLLMFFGTEEWRWIKKSDIDSHLCLSAERDEHLMTNSDSALSKAYCLALIYRSKIDPEDEIPDKWKKECEKYQKNSDKKNCAIS